MSEQQERPVSGKKGGRSSGLGGANKSPTRKVTGADILNELRGKIPPVRVPILYRLGLLLVALMMILLPLIYVGIIALCAYGVYYHTTENTTILAGRGGGRGRLLAYVAPLVVGVIVILFMVKPLFARAAKRAKPLAVDPRQQSFLFQFVHRICDVVGAPRPHDIHVDCEVNASASFRRGLISMLGHDLVLTLGLPLVAGLHLRQLAGVLAHEFGHFAQGTGMRFTYIIRSINAWFARVVYERDAWDEKLVKWSKEWDFRVGIVLYLARFMVWMTRRILWVLMWCGHFISSFMLRQMEFDADRYEARVAGSASFRSTVERLPLLAVASQAAFNDLRESWNERRLADDFPALVLFQLGEMPRDVKKKILAQSLQQKTGLFDSHPADKDRIRSVEAEKASGIFHVKLPSTVLFRDFPGLSKAVTFALYQEHLGQEVTRANLVSTEQLVKRQGEIQESIRAYRRYFQDCVDEETQIFPDAALAVPADVAASLEEIRSLRARLEPTFTKARAVLKTLQQTEQRVATLEILRALRQANLKFEPSQFDVRSSEPADLRSALEKAETERDALREKLSPVQRFLKRRFDLALGVMQSPAASQLRADLGASEEELRRLLQTVDHLRQEHETILRLEATCRINEVLASNMDENAHESNPALPRAIESGISKWKKQLTLLDASFQAVDYPFEHAGGKISLSRYLVEKLPARSADRGAYFHIAPAALERVQQLSVRIRGRLAVLAEKVETELAGLPALPLPDEEDER